MNIMAKARLVKITINVGVKEALTEKKAMEAVCADLATITGQKPAVKKAKKSIANFKLREGQPVGAMVTLRGQRAKAFLEKLIAIVLPRVRDFHGVALSGFDGSGNYTLGIKEQIVFPEIDYSKIDKIRGMEISIVTTAKNNEDAMTLFKEFGMPFAK